MPQIEHNNVGLDDGSRNPQFGTGLEIGHFWYVGNDVKTWFEEHRHQLIGDITPEILESAPPGALAIIRFVAKGSLLIPPGRESLLDKDVVPSFVNGLGDMYQEPSDQDRTTNYVIPIQTPEGNLEIVFNDAWGVGWRLAADHPAAANHPSLTKVQESDTSGYEDALPKVTYIAPETLAQATAKLVDIAQLAQDTHKYISMVLASGGRVDTFILSPGCLILGGDHFVGMQILDENGNGAIELLQDSFGIKRVEVHGITPYGQSQKTPEQAFGHGICQRLDVIHDLPPHIQ